MSGEDLQILIEILQKQVARNQDQIEALHVDTALVQGFPDYALALRGHYELNNSHCYRLMGILQMATAWAGAGPDAN